MSKHSKKPKEAKGSKRAQATKKRPSRWVDPDAQLTTEETLGITRRVFMETLRYQKELINRLNDNLTATQERCSGLLEEVRDGQRTRRQLEERIDGLIARIAVLEEAARLPNVVGDRNIDPSDITPDELVGILCSTEEPGGTKLLAPPYADPHAVVDGARPVLERGAPPPAPAAACERCGRLFYPFEGLGEWATHVNSCNAEPPHSSNGLVIRNVAKTLRLRPIDVLLRVLAWGDFPEANLNTALTKEQFERLIEETTVPKLPHEAVTSPHPQPPFSPIPGRWHGRGLVMDGNS